VTGSGRATHHWTRSPATTRRCLGRRRPYSIPPGETLPDRPPSRSADSASRTRCWTFLMSAIGSDWARTASRPVAQPRTLRERGETARRSRNGPAAVPRKAGKRRVGRAC
jgi:hypothetical protein